MCLYSHANKARCCCCCCIPLHCGVGVIRHLCLQRVSRKSDLSYLSKRSGGSRPSDKDWGGGGRSSRPSDKGAVSKEFFSALRASFWTKNKEGPGSPGLLPGSTTEVHSFFFLMDFRKVRTRFKF